METIFTFLINASIGLTLFYIVYWLFLRKETYYKINRVFLLFSIIFAILIPIFPFHYTTIVAPDQGANLFSAVSSTFKTIQPTPIETGEQALNLGWLEIVIIIYATGASIFLLRLLTQSAILINLIVKYKIKLLNGIRIVENEKYGLPFSFFNIVFLNPKFHKQEDLPEILAHEKVHIRENHWVDLLIIELLTVIFWFNPFIWFFERSIKQNHEYLADNAVLANGSKVSKYQALLVNQLMGMQIIGLTNNLNFALNTNRLKMMTKQKTPKIRALKLVWALPAIAILLVAFAEPKVQTNNQSIESGLSTNTLSDFTKDKITITGTVICEADGKPLPGASIIIKGTTIGTVSDSNGRYKLIDHNATIQKDNNGNSTYTSNIVVSYVGYKTAENKISVSGDAIKNNNFTIKLEKGVVLIGIEKALKQIPPPPPPPRKLKKSAKAPPPPPPLKEDKEKEVFFIVESMPEYPDGHAGLAAYIIKAAKKQAKLNKVKGEALVEFTVDASGSVTDINVLKSDNDAVAKAAYSIVSKMETWKPGSQRGKKVPVSFEVPIKFGS